MHHTPGRVSVLIAGLLAIASLTACSGSQPSAPATGGQPGPAGGQAAPKTNRLIIALEAPERETNEMRHLGPTTSWPMRPMYEYLLGHEATSGKLIPQLATDWKLEPDGSTFRLKLRQGVPFQGGNGNFSAQDINYSWKDLIQDGSLHPQSNYFRTTVKDIEPAGSDEALIRTTQATVNFVNAIGEQEAALVIQSKPHGEKLGTPTMQSPPVAGTGPYQFKERSQGAFIRFEKAPYEHWYAKPDFPEVEFRWMKEASTRLAALLAEEVHMTTLPPDLQPRAESSGFKVYKGRAAGLRVFLNIQCCFLNDPNDASKGYMYPDSPLMNVKVRQALNKAIDRDQLNKAFFANKGELMKVNHFHPSRLGWNPDWDRKFATDYGYDVNAAKRLLAEAGQSNLSTNIHLSQAAGVPGTLDVAEAIAGYWRAVGVKVDLVQMDPAERTNATRQFKFSNHFVMTGTSSSQWIGAMIYNMASISRGSGIEDPDIQKLMNQVNATLDEDKQGALWRQVGDLMFDRQVSIPLFWLPAEVLANPKVVSDYVFPGSITGVVSHVYNIKAVR